MCSSDLTYLALEGEHQTLKQKYHHLESELADLKLLVSKLIGSGSPGVMIAAQGGEGSERGEESAEGE